MILAMFVRIDDISSLLRGVALMVHLSESLVNRKHVEQFEARKIGDALFLITTFTDATTREEATSVLKTEFEAYARKANMPYAEASELIASVDRMASADGEEMVKQAVRFVKGEDISVPPESKPDSKPAPASNPDRSKMN